MANNVTLKIDGVSMGEIIGLGDIPTWTIRGAVVPGKKPIANSKKTAVDVKEFGTDMIIADIDIDNETYAYRIEIMQRLCELRRLYKGEHVTVEFAQTCASSTKTLTFDDCLCVDIDGKKAIDGAGGTFTFKFIYGNTNMKINQIKNGRFLVPNGTTSSEAKNWTGATAGGNSIAKRIKDNNGNFAYLLYADGSHGTEVYAFAATDSDASSDYVGIFNVELERIDNKDDFAGRFTRTDVAGSFVIGKTYTIKTTGDSTDFTTVGASSNTIGTIFQATGQAVGSGYTSPITNSDELVVGWWYKIIAVGAADFTTVGASSNTIGTIFQATGHTRPAVPPGECVWVIKADWMSRDKYYRIEVVGTTDFTTFGSPNNTVGTIFLVTKGGENGTGKTTAVTPATELITGDKYLILDLGISDPTDFTSIGAANNNIGTEFVATGLGTGSGTADTIVVGTWKMTTDVDNELTFTLAIYLGSPVIYSDTFTITKNTKQTVFKTAWELAASSNYACKISIANGQTGGIIIKRAWLETRKSDEC